MKVPSDADQCDNSNQNQEDKDYDNLESTVPLNNYQKTNFDQYTRQPQEQDILTPGDDQCEDDSKDDVDNLMRSYDLMRLTKPSQSLIQNFQLEKKLDEEAKQG